MDKIFSNKRRGLKIVLITLMLFLLSLYNYFRFDKTTVSLHDCLKNPEKYDLQTLNIFQDAKIVDIYDNGFHVFVRGDVILVKKMIDSKNIGKYISIHAVFHKEGFLEIINYHVYSGRKLRMLLSIFMTLLILYIFLKKYAFNFRKFEFRIKNA